MDLNPYEFEAPFTNYEFGHFAKRVGADLIIAACAWIQSTNAMDTIQYWVQRLLPVHNSDCIFICCNRIGQENDTTFAGASCVVQFSQMELQAFAAQNCETIVTATL